MKINFNRILEISYALKPKIFETKSWHLTFVLHKGKILSIGENSLKTHPRALKYNKYTPFIHSELSSLIRLGVEDCSRFDFVNVRIDRNNKTKMSAACAGCSKMLRQVGFNDFYYTNDGGGFSKWE